MKKITLLLAVLLLPVSIFGFSHKAQDFSKSDLRTMKKILSNDIIEYFDLDKSLRYFPERLQEFKATDEGRKLVKELNDKKNEITENFYYIDREVPPYDAKNQEFKIDLRDISFTQKNTQPKDIPLSSSVYFLKFISSDPHFIGTSCRKPEFFHTSDLDNNTINDIEIHYTGTRLYFNILDSNIHGEFIAIPVAIVFRNKSNGKVYYEYIVDNSELSNEDIQAILRHVEVDADRYEGDVDRFDAVRYEKVEATIAPPPPPPAPSEPIKNSVPDSEKIYEAVEQPADFPGGQSALTKWISRNLRYPEAAAAMGVQGRSIVQFVVEKDGSISNTKIVKGIDKELDAEAIRLVKSMPKWKPGRQQGEKVRSYYTLPINFKL